MTSPVTRHPPLSTLLLIAGAVLAAGCHKSGDDATPYAPPPDAASRARGFTSIKYFDEAPFQQQVKWRLSGADAQSRPDGLLFIQQAKLESYRTNGVLQVVIEAPECIYDAQSNTVNAAGHLQLRSGDGKIKTDGDGFLWRQDDSFLTISNHVYTVIKTSVWKPTKP